MAAKFHPLQLFPGFLSGAAGLLAFLSLHALWIRPIWFILPAGLVFSILGGAGAAWAYHEMRPGLPPAARSIPLLCAIYGLVLLPALLLAELLGPFPVDRFSQLSSTAKTGLILESVLLLLGTAVPLGSLAGWYFGRTRQAALAMGLTALLFAIGPGHNIPFLAGTPAVPKEAALLAAVILTSVCVLVISSLWVRPRS